LLLSIEAPCAFLSIALPVSYIKATGSGRKSRTVPGKPSSRRHDGENDSLIEGCHANERELKSDQVRPRTIHPLGSQIKPRSQRARSGRSNSDTRDERINFRVTSGCSSDAWVLGWILAGCIDDKRFGKIRRLVARVCVHEITFTRSIFIFISDLSWKMPSALVIAVDLSRALTIRSTRSIEGRLR